MNPTAPVCLLVGLGAGFALSSWIAPVADPTAEPSSTGALHARIQALTEERDTWKQRATAALQSPARVAMPAGAAPPGRNPGTPSPAVDGRSSATPATGTRPAGWPRRPPDPQAAARLLASVREALGAGDAETLQKLTPELAGQGELLVPDLVQLLAGADSLFAKENLAQLLGELRDPRALTSLQELLKQEANDAVRTAAVRALGQIPDPGSTALLAAEFGRPATSPMPASLAATSLGNIGSPAAVAALRTEIEQGGNPMVRAFALNALAAQESKQLVPFFLGQATRAGVSDRYRRSAIDAIVRTGDKGAIYQLRVLALSPETSRPIQEAAKRAVNKLAGQKIFDVR